MINSHRLKERAEKAAILGNIFSVSSRAKMLNKFSSKFSRQQWVLDDRSSRWELIKIGMPQGSILGPWQFLIYMNNIPINLISKVKLFVDDTSIFTFACKAWRFGIAIFSFFCTTFSEYWGIRSIKLFYKLSNR